MSSFMLLSPLSKPNAFDEYVKFKVRNNNGKKGSQMGPILQSEKTPNICNPHCDWYTANIRSSVQ